MLSNLRGYLVGFVHLLGVTIFKIAKTKILTIFFFYFYIYSFLVFVFIYCIGPNKCGYVSCGKEILNANLAFV